jgi:tetratricopeptide (TPR) repeat protein
VNKGVREIEKRLLQPAGDADRLGALLELGAHHAELGQDRDGLRAAREALEVARETGDGPASGHALALAARCHHQRADHFSAIASGIDALAALGDERAARSEVLRILALSLHALEQHRYADSAATESVRLAAGHERTEAAAREAYGRLLADRNLNQAARHQLRRAGALHRRVGDRSGLKRITARVADTYRNQAGGAQRSGKDEEARLQWRHAARVYRTALAFGRHGAYDAEILAGLAECECGLGDIDAAYEHAGMAVTLATDADAIGALARARLWESHALQAMSRLPAAERACGHAVAAAERAHDDPLLMLCLRTHARLNDLLGRFETGADLDGRARRLDTQRKAHLARTREQLGPLLDRVKSDA